MKNIYTKDDFFEMGAKKGWNGTRKEVFLLKNNPSFFCGSCHLYQKGMFVTFEYTFAPNADNHTVIHLDCL